MIVLLEAVEQAARFGRPKVTADKQAFCRARVLRVSVPLKKNWSPRRREKFMRGALAHLADQGVTKILTPQDFEYKHLVRACGFSSPDTAALRRALAPLRIDRVLSTHFQPAAAVTAAVYAARPSRECDAAVLTLLKKCRTVAVSFQRGGADYPAKIYASHGATILQTAAALDSASLALILDHPPDFRPSLGAAVIDCTAGARLKLPDWFAPHPFAPDQMAAELHRAGVLKMQDIEMIGIINTNTLDFLPTTHYNIAQFPNAQK